MIAANRSLSTKLPDECLIPGCHRRAVARGLCEPCVVSARRLVSAGKTTFADLEAMGLARPALRGPGKLGPFLQAFATAKQRAQKKQRSRR